MRSVYERTVTILPSRLDISGHLGLPDAFALFMDTGAAAAEQLGAGWGTLARRDIFWITVKTMIRFVDPPCFLDRVQISAQLEPTQARRCRTHYRMHRDGRTLALGKTEWAFVDLRAGRQLPVADILPGDLPFSESLPFPDAFPRIEDAFDERPWATHRVSAMDIDAARHMNNVAYVRAIANAFSVEEWEALRVREMAIVFLSSALEGETLELRRRTRGRVTDVQISRPNGERAALARLTGAE